MPPRKTTRRSPEAAAAVASSPSSGPARASVSPVSSGGGGGSTSMTINGLRTNTVYSPSTSNTTLVSPRQKTGSSSTVWVHPPRQASQNGDNSPQLGASKPTIKVQPLQLSSTVFRKDTTPNSSARAGAQGSHTSGLARPSTASTRRSAGQAESSTHHGSVSPSSSNHSHASGSASATKPSTPGSAPQRRVVTRPPARARSSEAGHHHHSNSTTVYRTAEERLARTTTLLSSTAAPSPQTLRHNLARSSVVIDSSASKGSASRRGPAAGQREALRCSVQRGVSASTPSSSPVSSPVLHLALDVTGNGEASGSRAPSSLLRTAPVFRSSSASSVALSDREPHSSVDLQPAGSGTIASADGMAAACPVERQRSRGSASPSLSNVSPSASAAFQPSPSGSAPAAEKPWLAPPPIKGILKDKSTRRSRLMATTTSFFANVTAPSLNSTAPPSLGGSLPSAASETTTSSTGAGRAPLFSTSLSSRHVQFDEANIQYLDASASHVVYDDTKLGMQLDSVEWGTVMLSSTAINQFSGIRRPNTGTALSMGKAKPSSWGADSEWFNAEFGAQLTPRAGGSKSSSTSFLSGAAAAPELSGASPTAAPTVLTPVSVLSSAQSSSLATSPFTSGAPPAPTHHTPRSKKRGSMARTMPDYEDGTYTSLGAPVSSGRPKTRPKPSVPMNAHLVSVLQRPPTPPSMVSLDSVAIAAAGPSMSGSEEETAHGGTTSPVLMYDRELALPTTNGVGGVMGSLRSSVSSSPSPAIDTPASTSDTFVPAPPLSVGALRHRPSSAPLTLGSVTTSRSSLGDSTRRHGSGSGSRPRLSSPGVSLTNVDPSVLNMENSFDDLGGGLDVDGFTDLGATVPPTLGSSLSSSTPLSASQRQRDEAASAAAAAAAATNVLKLSAAERRLLRAVMHVHQREHHGSIPSTVTPGGTTSGHTNRTLNSSNNTNNNSVSTSSSGSGGALRDSVRALGDPRKDALSSGIRQFLHNKHKHAGPRGAKQRTTSPAAAEPALLTTTRQRRRSSSASVTPNSPSLEFDSHATLHGRTRVVGTPVGSNGSFEAQSTGTPRGSKAAEMPDDRRPRENDVAAREGWGGRAGNSGGSNGNGNGNGALGPPSAGVLNGPATAGPVRGSSAAWRETSIDGMRSTKPPTPSALSTKPVLQQPPPPRSHPAERRESLGEDEDEDESEPHLRAPVPTVRIPRGTERRRRDK